MRRWIAGAALAAAFCATTLVAADLPRVHALSRAWIVVAPGQVIDSGTVIVRDGIIEAVGKDLNGASAMMRLEG